LSAFGIQSIGQNLAPVFKKHGAGTFVVHDMLVKRLKA